MIFKLIIILILCLIGVLAFGLFWTDSTNANHSISGLLVSGIVTGLALMQVLSIPAIYLRISLSHFAIASMGLMLILTAILLAKKGKQLWKLLLERIQTVKWEPLLVILLLLIAIQMFMFIFAGHIDDDDAYYVATATTAVTTDTMYQFDPYTGDLLAAFPARYVLSPFPIVYAVLSYFTGVSATVLAHTVMPVVWLVFAYCIYEVIAANLYGSAVSKRRYLLIFLSIINIFSAGAKHLQGTMLLNRIWQGKAILATCLLPLCFATIMWLHGTNYSRKTYLWIIVLMLACCYASSMGIALGAVAVGIYALSELIITRQGRQFLLTMCCCIPNVIYAVIYIIIR